VPSGRVDGAEEKEHRNRADDGEHEERRDGTQRLEGIRMLAEPLDDRGAHRLEAVTRARALTHPRTRA